MILLNVKEAAEYLKVSPHTLATWRARKTGPKFVKLGRSVKYPKDCLDTFIKQNLISTQNKNANKGGKL